MCDVAYCWVKPLPVPRPQFRMVVGSEAQGLYSLKFHYCRNRLPGPKLPYSFTVSSVFLCLYIYAQLYACINLNASSAGGGDREESRRLPVCSRNSSVSPLHWYGWSLLHRCHGVGVHTHEAQVQSLYGRHIGWYGTLFRSCLYKRIEHIVSFKADDGSS